MTSRSRQVAALLLCCVAFVVAVTSFQALEFSAAPLLAPLLSHSVHLLAAFVAGCTLLRIPRVAPREALDLVLVALTLGLGALALLELLACWAGLVYPATPWVVDGVALLVGIPRIRPAYERCVHAWRHLDLSVVMVSRIPLYAALVALSFAYFVPALLPATSDTSAAQLALPAQAAIRNDLGGAVATRPGEWATPSAALLLHGHLSGGPVGASLFPLTFGVLLGCAAHLHARRRLGPRTASWTALCLASMPALLLLVACDPSSAWLVLLVGLAYHELGDWCGKAVGGKIALASIYGGLAAAESPRGAAAFAMLLAFLFLVQALVDRHGLFRQLPGITGMVAIAAACAAPFIALSMLLAPGSWLETLVARYGPHASGFTSRALLAASAPVSAAAAFGTGAATADWARRALEIGPLVLGLLLFVPLVASPPEGLRHAVIAGTLFLLLWIAPAPYGSGIGLLLPLSAAAGAAGTWMLAPWGWPSRAARVLVAVSAFVTLLVSLHLGPDLFAGMRLLTGRIGQEAYLASTVPDADLIQAVAALPEDSSPNVLLLGELTDCRYTTPVTRLVPGLDGVDADLAVAFRKARVTYVAQHRGDDGAAPAPGLPLDGLTRVGTYGANGRFELFRVPPSGWLRHAAGP